MLQVCASGPVCTGRWLMPLRHLPFLALPLLSAASSAATRRIETPLVFDWRFQRGDLPFNGGPLLCSDQPEEVAFPISLRGKACTLGSREKWSLITGTQPIVHLFSPPYLSLSLTTSRVAVNHSRQRCAVGPLVFILNCALAHCFPSHFVCG